MSYRQLFRIESLPVLQNKVFSTVEQARTCAVGDMCLVQDDQTGLIFNSAFNPRLLEYGSDYQNEQACSGVFQDHLDKVMEVVYGSLQGKSILEIGCGKGYFLQRLLEAGFDAIGIDPAYEGDSPHVLKKRFSPALGISAEGIIMRHVLEHIPDPIEFLFSVKEANNNAGIIYIEVPCFDWICAHKAWFDIYYEHVNYLRLADFYRIFGKVYKAGHLFGGQYLYVVADLSSLRHPAAEVEDLVYFPTDFLQGIHYFSEYARKKDIQKKIAIWGGASKGVIFSLYLERNGIHIDAVIDINPAKQGKYLPCTGIRVSSPKTGLSMLRRRDIIFVMNSNYLDEVVESSCNQFQYLKVDQDEF